MFFVRWIPTFLAFPLAGWLARDERASSVIDAVASATRKGE